jgi:hypothetical protein
MEIYSEMCEIVCWNRKNAGYTFIFDTFWLKFIWRLMKLEFEYLSGKLI